MSELILWVSELIPLYFGCLNLYFGCLNLYFRSLLIQVAPVNKVLPCRGGAMLKGSQVVLVINEMTDSRGEGGPLLKGGSA